MLRSPDRPPPGEGAASHASTARGEPHHMPIPISSGRPTLAIRRVAYEQAELSRAQFDERLGLTADEFRVEGDLICIGPIHNEDGLSTVTAELESLGLSYFDDFFELSGNWPSWLSLHAMAGRRDTTPTAR